jgi:hypothetical protein
MGFQKSVIYARVAASRRTFVLIDQATKNRSTRDPFMAEVCHGLRLGRAEFAGVVWPSTVVVPGELRSCVQPDGSPQKFHLEGFMKRLQEQLGVDRCKAKREAKAVFAALWSAVGSEAFNDMRSELPKDFGRCWTRWCPRRLGQG